MTVRATPHDPSLKNPMDGQSTAVPKPCPDHLQLTAHYGWVHAVARNLVRDPWGAEDVTQETLLAALASPPPEVPDDQRLRAWLARVAFNLSRLGARQGARRRAREVRVARRESLPSVTDELESAGTFEALSRAIDELEEPYRDVVLMRYFDGLSTAEIAERSGASELAVRKRLWRARNKLRAALDHDPISGRLLAALAPWLWFSRGGRVASLGGLAAGLALVAGATWWSGRDDRGAPEVALLSAQPASEELALASEDSPSDEPAVRGPLAPPAPVQARRPLPPVFVPERAPVVERDQPRAAHVLGVVLDLEGQPRAGFELVDPRNPERVLATSDAFGAFSMEARGAPPRMEARAAGWTTVVAVRLADGDELLARPLVVAQARDLAISVHDESGRPIEAAELELRCAENAFARIPYPVQLESAVLRLFRTDEQGRSFAPELPRGTGLALAVRAPGFEPRELDTLELGSEERIFLRALASEFLAGRVFFRDGRPAAGARVSLGLASTTADAEGRYRLPLHGVRADSSLDAQDPYKSAAPIELKAFGARVAEGVGQVDLVLGEEYDAVDGQLLGDQSGGWTVLAFSKASARLDAEGNEEPSAITESTSDGRFAFRLSRGTYDLYAVAPDAPHFTERHALETRMGRWQVELPPAPATQGFHAQARTSDGLALAGARVDVRMRVEGEHGPRRLPWRTLTGDEQGVVAFSCAPDAQLELGVAHPAVGRQAAVLSARSAVQQLVLPRAAFVQVAEAGPRAERGRVLDGDGRVLAVRGPLHSDERFGFQAGWSPVLEVPSGARWLEFQEAGAASVLLPIEPRPGAVLQVRP